MSGTVVHSKAVACIAIGAGVSVRITPATDVTIVACMAAGICTSTFATIFAANASFTLLTSIPSTFTAGSSVVLMGRSSTTLLGRFCRETKYGYGGRITNP
jgi:hypothetical protein